METHEHLNHRARIRRRFLASDPRTLDDYQLLELLLFYTIPRQDTNPIAHRILTHFGSLERVLEASEEELCSVSGVGPRSAALILTVAQYVQRVFHPDPTEHTPSLHFYDDFLQTIRREMNMLPEGLWVLTLDARWRLIEKTHCPEETLACCLRPILTGHGVCVVLLWNYHRYQTAAFPSPAQRSFTRLMREKCLDLGVSVELCARIAGSITEYLSSYDWER